MIPIIGLMIGCYIVARSIEMIDVSLAENHGYSRKELRDIERIMRENLETLRNEWDAFCGGDTHTA